MSAGSLIARLDRWLSAHRPDYYRELQPGLSPADLAAFQAKLGVQLPEAFQQFYQWRNGQSSNCYDALQNNRQFASATAVVESKQVLDEMLEGGDFDREDWWHTEWIPFLDNGGGDHLCLDMAGTFTGRPGQVICFWHDWEARSVEYPSFEKWLEVFVGSLEAGLWEEVDGDFHIKGDELNKYHPWQKYLQKHNPGYPLRHQAGSR